MLRALRQLNPGTALRFVDGQAVAAFVHGVVSVASDPVPADFVFVGQVEQHLLGICIVSTSHGVLNDAEAREKNMGGEVLATVW